MSGIDGPQLADTEAILYNFKAAEKYLAASDPDDPNTKIETLALEVYRAVNDEDYVRAVAPTEASYKMYLASTDLQFSNSATPCYLGLVYGMTGRMAEAEAAFTRGGRFVQCYSYRAQVIDHSGDWGGAVKAYQAAIALAPDLPTAYDFWGQALARHGDLYGAAAAFHEANKRGPHWADPLKHWGDVLLRQKKIAEAHAKYTEALVYAPDWPELKAAAAKTGGGR